MSVSWFIEGIPILGDFTFPLTTGVAASTGVAIVPPSSLSALLAIGRKKRNAVTMTAVPEGGVIRKYEKLNILRNTNASDPNLSAVVIADRRIWWPRKFVYREINLRRNTGVKRRASYGKPLITDPVIDILKYAKFSLGSDGKPVKADKILEELISYIDLTGVEPEVQDRKILKSLPLENVTLRGNGHDALSQLLTLIAGAEVTISNDGTPIIFSWASGAERAIVGTGLIAVNGSAGPEQFSGGHVELIDRANERPSSVKVLFDIEAEIRFDFVGDVKSEVDATTETGGTSTPGIAQGVKTPRYIQNVIPVPDFTLTMSDGRSVVTGTWVPVFEYLESINKLAKPGLKPAINFTTVFRAMVPFQRHLWAGMGLIGDAVLGTEEANWSARIGALQRHTRQTWQIPRDWMDRIRVLKNHMVATVDTSRGTRAQSRIYSDHFRLNSAKAIFLEGGPKSYGANVPGFPGKDGVPREIEVKDAPAPADLLVLDPDLGILHTAYKADPNGNYQEALPAFILHNPNNEKKPANAKGTVYFNSLSSGSDRFPQLDPESFVSVLLTATPANQLFAVTVKPGDIGSLLPEAVHDGMKDATGPPMVVYTTRETARVAWSQTSPGADAPSAADAIDKAFSMGVSPSFENLTAATDALRPHVMNFAGSVAGSSSLFEQSREIAAKIYAKYTDRVQGSMSGYLSDSIHPVGSISQVEHSINSEGKLETRISLREELPEFDVRAWLDPGTQRILLRLIKPGS